MTESRTTATAARRMADGWAETLILVETTCAATGCAPDCRVAVAVRQAAVSAYRLAVQLAT